MITPMKKFTIIAQSSKLATSVETLGGLGLIHPEISRFANSELDRLREELSNAQRALVLVSQTKKGKAKGKKAAIQEELPGEEAVARVVNLAASQNELWHELAQLGKEAELLVPWGDFDITLLAKLRADSRDEEPAPAGMALEFASIDKSQLAKIPEELRYIVLSREKSAIRIVAIDSGLSEAGIQSFRIGSKNLGEIKERIAFVKQSLSEIDDAFEDYAKYSSAVRSRVEALQAALEYELVNENFDKHGELAVLQGYAPADEEKKIQVYCTSAGLGLITEEPGEEDPVPTVLKNPKPVRIIEPVLKMLETYPGYRERDISFWFLLFFIMFFAMIIGDAGYGTIFLLVSGYLAVRAKASKRNIPDMLLLVMVLSIATVLWGAVTGNWFGYEAISKLPFFSQFIIPELDAYAAVSTATVQLICFILGTAQLGIARLLQAIDKFRGPVKIQALGQIGWLSVVLGLYYLVLNLVIDAPYLVPDYSLYMIIGGIAFVFLFENQEGDGFFRGVLRSLQNIIQLALNGVGAFGDLISYIRLFAVGLAGIEIAKSFNAMADSLMLGMPGVIGIMLGALVLLAGHSLNMAMAVLSVVVHGVRLNMLEFSNHVGNAWAGQAYKPFSANKIKD